MPKSDLPFGPGEYAPVAARIALFYAVHPTGRIVTNLMSRSDSEITFRAAVYRNDFDERPAATGWASERPGDGDVNAVACLENTETSAVGRALANLGFTASIERPSAEEMEKAARERARLVRERVRLVGEGARGNASGAARSDGSPAAKPSRSASGERDLQHAANAVHDVLSLLLEAEALGMSSGRATRLRRWLLAPDVEPELVERVERALRGWISRRRQSVLRGRGAG